MMLERRKFLMGLIAAPFVVRSGILMPVRQLIKPEPISLTTKGVAVLEYSNDGINWMAGPIIDLAMPGIKTSAGVHRFWRAKMLTAGDAIIDITMQAPTNVFAA